MKTQDLLFEIGAEEMPAKLLKPLAKALADGMRHGLNKALLTHGEITYYATPRRLAILVKELQNKQSDRTAERKGPALQAAFDSNGRPTPALEGFARSCQTTIENLTKIETANGGWFIYRYSELGKSVAELLPEIINKLLTTLPIPKPMQWGDSDLQFIRPVHWTVLLYGKDVIPATILGLSTGRITYGHRFHHPEALEIAEANEYAALLKNKGFVIADFAERQQIIRQQIEDIASKRNARIIMNTTLLDEVTGLVEWPTALLANFDPEFLTVPHEALIAALEVHQKCFPLEDEKHHLLPFFITVSNIVSKEPHHVIRGNERVVRARLSDAKFFYETDCKRKLADRLEDLKHIVFQAKLGSLYDKSVRIEKLAKSIALPLDCEEVAARAGLLSKADLASEMVGEFPELQGIMGDYYARHDGEAPEIAIAIQEQYLPRFSGDRLPNSLAGCAVALADRLDSLIGIFGINQIPTGDKDPFGLRRAALSVLRILIEKQLNHNLLTLLEHAQLNYQHVLPNPNAVSQAHEFILERLHAWYQDQGISGDTLAAVLAVERDLPFDIDHRVKAVQAFRLLPEAQALAAANKRVSNILKQAHQQGITLESNPLHTIDLKLFGTEERALYDALINKIELHSSYSNDISYTEQLTDLAALREPVDRFFEVVLVMDEDERLRNNRLALLTAMRQLFLAVADVSLLQS